MQSGRVEKSRGEPSVSGEQSSEAKVADTGRRVTLAALWRGYRRSLAHFAARAREAPGFVVVIGLSLLAQVVTGAGLTGSWLLGGAAPFVQVISASVAAAIVLHFTPDAPAKPGPLRRPWLQLALVVGFVVLHFLVLAPQLPGGSNPVARLVSPLARLLGNVPFMNLLCVALPALILLPLARKPAEFGLRGFSVPLLAWLFLGYVPMLLLTVRPNMALLIGAAVYLVEAALPEEFLYRVLLQGRLERLFRERLHAIALAALAFGFMHLPINVQNYGWLTGTSYCLGINTFGGLFIGYLYSRSRSFPLIVLLHWWAGVAAGAANP